MRRYLSWRIGRRDYALGLAVYLFGYFGVYFLVSSTLAQTALPLIWILALAVPRLRDIGWNTGWSIAPFAAAFIVGFANAVAARAMGAPWPIAGLLSVSVGVGSLVFMVLLAFKRSRLDADEMFG